MFHVPFIFKLLDLMAMHKLNKLHWHLTDDQGWRLEIKALPRLTDIGAWRGASGDRYGGFYTHDDVHAVVEYAAARFIEVVPEIELPGHCKAALACYPELSCTSAVHDVPTEWGVQDDVYCSGAHLHSLRDMPLSHAQSFPVLLCVQLCALCAFANDCAPPQ